MDKYEQGIVSNLYIFFSIDETKMNGDFLIQYFETPFWHEEITKIAQEGARNHGLLNVKVSEFFETQHRWPCLEEQEKIANFFTGVDEEISSEDAKLAEMQAYKKSMLQKVFSREITFGSQEWQEVRLGEVAEIISSKRIFQHEYVSNGIPFYRGKEISELKENIPIKDILYISFEKYEEIKKQFPIPQKNDILITAVGTIGNVYLIKDNNPFYFKDGNLIWLRNITADSLYICYVLDFLKKDIILISSGSSQNALTIEKLKELRIPLPCLEEQEKIAGFFTVLDEQIRLQQQKVADVRLYKKSMLQKMLG
ncbi:MAG: restriction endonuclease subunit S [Brevinema sp.]